MMVKKSVIIVISISQLLWSLSFIFIKAGLNGISPVALASLRYVLVSVIMLAITLFFFKPAEIFKFACDNFFPLAGAGISVIFLANTLQNIGMLYTTASVSSLLQSSSPVFTIMLAAYFLKEEVGMRKTAGLLISIIGIFLIITANDPHAFEELRLSMFGNLLLLLTALCFAVYNVLLKKVLTPRNIFMVLAITSIIGTIPTVCLWVFIEPVNFSYSVFTWAIILGLVIICSILGSIAFAWSLDKMEASKASFFSFLVPVFSTVCAHFILGEPITGIMVLSGILIMAGIMIAEKEV